MINNSEIKLAFPNWHVIILVIETTCEVKPENKE